MELDSPEEERIRRTGNSQHCKPKREHCTIIIIKMGTPREINTSLSHSSRCVRMGETRSSAASFFRSTFAKKERLEECTYDREIPSGSG